MYAAIASNTRTRNKDALNIVNIVLNYTPIIHALRLEITLILLLLLTFYSYLVDFHGPTYEIKFMNIVNYELIGWYDCVRFVRIGYL